MPLVGWSDWREQWSEWAAEDAAGTLWYLAMMHKYTTARWIFEILAELESNMARGKGASAAEKMRAGQAKSWTTFVNVSLGDATLADIAKAIPYNARLVEAIEELICEGYRLSFSFVESNDSVNCSLTGTKDHPHAGKTLSSFAPTWVQALQINLYKHYHLLEQDWTKTGEDGGKPKFG